MHRYELKGRKLVVKEVSLIILIRCFFLRDGGVLRIIAELVS